MDIADFDLMDEEGDAEWPMSGGTRLDRIIVGRHAENYSDWVTLSHFKGQDFNCHCPPSFYYHQFRLHLCYREG